MFYAIILFSCFIYYFLLVRFKFDQFVFHVYYSCLPTVETFIGSSVYQKVVFSGVQNITSVSL